VTTPVVWRPHGFSKNLSLPTQVFGRELLDYAASIHHFLYILEGKKFTIFKDYKLLTFTASRVSYP
jgi:hypothetical protein